MKLSGTARTLDEAIEQALCIGPMSEVKDRLYHYIRDFIANKMQASILMTRDHKSQQELSDLFELLTKRRSSEQYWATQHGCDVRVVDNSPTPRHGLVVQIVETAPEWVEPLVLWDGSAKPERVQGHALYLE